MEWYRQPVKKVLAAQEVDGRHGLSAQQVSERLRLWGLNHLATKTHFVGLKIFLRQFKSPLIYLLFAAGLVAFFLNEILDTIVIGVALVVNALVGFFQEYKASSAFAALKRSVSYRARVRRDGQVKMVDAAEVVPGDILILKAGDRVAADARLIKARNLQVDESQLTGESFPVDKSSKTLSEKRSLADQTNMVFMGTAVQRGEGEAVVIATGAQTELGKIARLVEQTDQELTPFQLQLRKLSRIIGLIVVLIALIIFLVGVLVPGYSPREVFVTAVAVAVAAVPEGLPVALTVVLALAATRILRKKGLIRHLASSETLGSANIIATDKTGTLTRGKMALRKVEATLAKPCSLFASLQDPDKLLLLLAALNADAEGSATDQAILEGALKSGLVLDKWKHKSQRLAYLPFDTARKYLLSVWQVKKQAVVIVSGAPERLMDLAQLKQETKQKLYQRLEALALDGFRVIGVGYRRLSLKEAQKISDFSDEQLVDLARGLNFCGLLALEDPIRPDAKRAIDIARQAGIRTIMVTGDHPLTAKAIGRRLGFRIGPRRVLTGADLDVMEVDDLERQVEEVDIYARVNPTHKLKIIQAWQRRQAVVAMTGDGVNDAPALKKADIGVAVGSGTQVAQEAADLVLLDDNFATIVESIRQGRTVFENMKKTALYLLADSFSEATLIFGSILLALPLPILAAQILWVNLVDDSFSGFSFAFEPSPQDVMRRPPRSKQAPLFGRVELGLLLLIGFLTGPAFLALFWWLVNQGLPLAEVRTLMFAGIGLDALLYAFSIKALHQPIWRVNLFDNKVLILGVGFGILALLAGIYFPPLQRLLRTVPLSLNDWWLIGFIALVLVGAIESLKLVLHRNQR